MAKGPLAVRCGEWTLDDPHAGAVGRARVELENAGTVVWRDGIRLAYHWLDDRGNPIVWDGERTPLPELAPGERATVDARVRAPDPARPLPLRARPRRRAPRLVLGARQRDGRGRRSTCSRARARPAPSARHGSSRRPEAAERIAAAHAEGYAVVAGAIEWLGGVGRRRPRRARAVRAGPGPDPGLRASAALPVGARRDRAGAARGRGGLPAFAAPAEERVALRRPDRAAGAPEAPRERARADPRQRESGVSLSATVLTMLLRIPKAVFTGHWEESRRCLPTSCHAGTTAAGRTTGSARATSTGARRRLRHGGPSARDAQHRASRCGDVPGRTAPGRRRRSAAAADRARRGARRDRRSWSSSRARGTRRRRRHAPQTATTIASSRRRRRPPRRRHTTPTDAPRRRRRRRPTRSPSPTARRCGSARPATRSRRSSRR